MMTEFRIIKTRRATYTVNISEYETDYFIRVTKTSGSKRYNARVDAGHDCMTSATFTLPKIFNGNADAITAAAMTKYRLGF